MLSSGNKTLRGFAALPKTIVPIGLAHTGSALLVSHAAGILRVDLTSRIAQPITTPTAVDLGGLHSLAWHQGALLAIQRDTSKASVVRIRFNGRGSAVTAVDVLHPTAATAATLAGDAYHFLTESPEEGLTFRHVPAVK